MKTSKSFLELEKRIKEENIKLDAVDKSILHKISKCSEDEVHAFVKTGVLPAIKLTDKELKVIKAGWKVLYKFKGKYYGVKDDKNGSPIVVAGAPRAN